MDKFRVILKARKAQKSFIWEAVTLCASALIIVFVAGFFNKLYAIAVSEKDDGSKANFNNKIDAGAIELMEGSEERDYRLYNYFIGSDLILVGFDKNWDDEKETDLKTSSNIYRPYKCGTSACICLYNEEWEPANPSKRDRGVIRCVTEPFAGKDVAFISEANTNPKTSGSARDDGKGNYLVIYGSEWKTQRLYMEKNYDKAERKYYLYISKIDEDRADDPANIRKRSIDSAKSG